MVKRKNRSLEAKYFKSADFYVTVPMTITGQITGLNLLGIVSDRSDNTGSGDR